MQFLEKHAENVISFWISAIISKSELINCKLSLLHIIDGILLFERLPQRVCARDNLFWAMKSQNLPTYHTLFQASAVK
jgi:hypothetical protein